MYTDIYKRVLMYLFRGCVFCFKPLFYMGLLKKCENFKNYFFKIIVKNAEKSGKIFKIIVKNAEKSGKIIL